MIYYVNNRHLVLNKVWRIGNKVWRIGKRVDCIILVVYIVYDEILCILSIR